MDQVKNENYLVNLIAGLEQMSPDGTLEGLKKYVLEVKKERDFWKDKKALAEDCS